MSTQNNSQGSSNPDFNPQNYVWQQDLQRLVDRKETTITAILKKHNPNLNPPNIIRRKHGKATRQYVLKSFFAAQWLAYYGDQLDLAKLDTSTVDVSIRPVSSSVSHDMTSLDTRQVVSLVQGLTQSVIVSNEAQTQAVANLNERIEELANVIQSLSETQKNLPQNSQNPGLIPNEIVNKPIIEPLPLPIAQNVQLPDKTLNSEQKQTLEQIKKKKGWMDRVKMYFSKN